MLGIKIYTLISKGLFLISILFLHATDAFSAENEIQVNDRPIIGILSQEISYKLNETYKGQFSSYIAASYVKYIESAGARVVPIRIGQPESYYENLLQSINGVLFPGGTTYFNNSNGYADAGEIIYRIAENFNDNNDYFPIWGTCLGFELLTYLAANRSEHRSNCFSQKQTMPLKFVPKYRKSKLFGNAPDSVIQILKNENVTANFHQYCVTKEDLNRVNLRNTFRVLSTNHDLNGLKFISTLEHIRMPFYGVQFHPEKNPFEWAKGKNIPHSANSIKISYYFADFFVNEARKNQHRFFDKSEENEALIYNHIPTFTGLKGSSFEQCYLFK